MSKLLTCSFLNITWAMFLPGALAVFAQAQVPSSGLSVPYKPTVRIAKPDVSIQPIVADEPIKPPGFPPLPDYLDLPISVSYGHNPQNPLKFHADGPSGQVQSTGVHQHYTHYAPNAFVPRAEQANPSPYRVGGADYYNVNGVNSGSPESNSPNFKSAAQEALQKLGTEPRLNPRSDVIQKPEVPTAVVVSQSTTQDLSLPDDEFSYHRASPNNSAGKRMARQMGNMLMQRIYSMGSQAAGSASSVLRYR